MFLSLIPCLTLARSIDLRDYVLISRGMSEAEVLRRLGPPDHEAFRYFDYGRGTEVKTWSYLPEKGRSGQWTTEIVLESRRVISKERYKAFSSSK
jgi:hypothetical protein